MNSVAEGQNTVEFPFPFFFCLFFWHERSAGRLTGNAELLPCTESNPVSTKSASRGAVFSGPNGDGEVSVCTMRLSQARWRGGGTSGSACRSPLNASLRRQDSSSGGWGCLQRQCLVEEEEAVERRWARQRSPGAPSPCGSLEAQCGRHSSIRWSESV